MSKFDILKINNETCFYPSAAEGWCYTEKVVTLKKSRNLH